MKKILVINSGSSSLKFQLIEMPSEAVLASGLVERIGQASGKLHYNSEDFSTSEEKEIKDHAVALHEVTKHLMHGEYGVIKNSEEIPAIGHRVVHGGESFSDTILIDEAVKQKIRDLFSLAPLHNPPNLKGIEVAEDIFPNAKQFAIFDTAFHQSIPPRANHYAIPTDFYTDKNIRVYGFHGTSHKYVSEKANHFLGRQEVGS